METTCHCSYKEGEEIRYCSVCLNHLCKSVEQERSMCSNCMFKCAESGSLKKDNKGRYIDPEKQIPLATCICGEDNTPDVSMFI